MKEINITDNTEEIKVNENKKNVEVEAKTKEKLPTEETKKIDGQNEKQTNMKKKILVGNGEINKRKAVIILTIIGLVFLLGLAAFYYFGIYKYNPRSKDEDIVEIKNEYITTVVEPEVLSQLLVNKPGEPKTEESPLNGLLFTKSEMEDLMKRRPVAVMINNHAVARPQSGLSSADIVYETLAESGITRYMAFFWSEGPEKVGSIRSARQYYLEWLSPYDPLYIHIGWADTEDPRTDARGNIIAYKIKDVGIIGYWQWVDSGRQAPHDKYNSVQSAWEYAITRGWTRFPSNFESWKFKNDANSNERGDGYRYEIVFHKTLNNGGLYDVVWEYNKSTNSYKRWVGGKPDIDQETGTQVTAKVVVAQEVVMTPAYDNKGRIIIETIGEGEAVILMDGKEINATWEKDSRMDRTNFYDSEGNEIEFNRGRIWISGIPQSVGKFDIIEQ